MTLIFAYLLGMYEFRRGFTTHLPSRKERNAYDRGRERMHRMTFRRYED